MKRWLRLLFQIASILIFLLIVWWSGPETLAKIATGIPKFVLLALFLRGLAGMIATSRLKVNTAGIAGEDISWRRLYYVTMTTRALGLVIPRSISTLGGKSVALRSHGISTRRSVWIVMLDNLFDMILLGLMAIPAIMVLYGVLSKWQGGALAIFLILLLGIAVWWAARGDHLTAVLLYLQKYPRLKKLVGEQLNQNERLFPAPKHALSAYGFTISLNIVLVLSFYYIALAVNVNSGLSAFVLGFPLVQLSLVAAVTPGGLGIFDLGWLGLLTINSVPEAEALTFVVAQRAYLTFFVLVWTGLSILLRLTERLKSN